MTERDALVWALGFIGLPLVTNNFNEVVIECHEDSTDEDPAKDVIFGFDIYGEFIEVEVKNNNE